MKIFLYSRVNSLYSEVVQHFDPKRRMFTPYGLTCERWEPVLMERPDRHNEIELNLLEQGTLTYLMWGQKISVHGGRLAVFWAAIPHQIIECKDMTPYYWVTVPLAWVLEWKLPEALIGPLLRGQVAEETDAKHSESDLRLCQQWSRDLENHAEDTREIILLEMKARLLRLARTVKLSGHGRTKAGKSRVIVGQENFTKVEAMARYIALNCTRPIQAEDIGREVGLNPDYAGSLFRRTFGTTLNKYLIDHRISHAQRLLVTTDDKILEVALESGFNSLSRFNDAFKRACGSSPSKYRRL
ncbi:MAG: helix-turn-helix domain-containing protein, partial [Verrucomicrobiales bacterium]|nr:helix-turn-helix domain-containing protein [Verrucomicrobiales bacterium]